LLLVVPPTNILGHEHPPSLRLSQRRREHCPSYPLAPRYPTTCLVPFTTLGTTTLSCLVLHPPADDARCPWSICMIPGIHRRLVLQRCSVALTSQSSSFITKSPAYGAGHSVCPSILAFLVPKFRCRCCSSTEFGRPSFVSWASTALGNVTEWGRCIA
jgi:hypothetical protein